MKIKIKCNTGETAKLEDLIAIQGGLKMIDDTIMAKLKKNLLTKGFKFPVYIWIHEGKSHIIDGVHRQMALRELLKENHTIDEDQIPVCHIEAKNMKDAKIKVLRASSKYSKIDQEIYLDGVKKFGLSLKEMKEYLEFDDISLDYLEYLTDTEGAASKGMSMKNLILRYPKAKAKRFVQMVEALRKATKIKNDADVVKKAILGWGK